MQISVEMDQEIPNVKKLKEWSSKIDEIDQLSKIVEKTYPMLAPIINYFQTNKANLGGDNIKSIALNSVLSFQQCATSVSIINEFIDDTLKANGFQKAERAKEL